MGDDKTILAALGEEGGQQIFNEAVLRRLRVIEHHAVSVDARLDDIEAVQAPISEVFREVRRIFIKVIGLIIAGLILSELSGVTDIATYIGQ